MSFSKLNLRRPMTECLGLFWKKLFSTLILMIIGLNLWWVVLCKERPPYFGMGNFYILFVMIKGLAMGIHFPHIFLLCVWSFSLILLRKRSAKESGLILNLPPRAQTSPTFSLPITSFCSFKPIQKTLELLWMFLMSFVVFLDKQLIFKSPKCTFPPMLIDIKLRLCSWRLRRIWEFILVFRLSMVELKKSILIISLIKCFSSWVDGKLTSYPFRG